MKKIYFITIILTAILFTGCEDMFYEYYTYDWKVPEDINTKEDIRDVLIRSKYSYRHDVASYANYPDETYYDKSVGLDCEDTAVLGACMWYENLGHNDVYMVGLKSLYTNTYHMIYRVGNTYYQSTGYRRGLEYSNWQWDYELYEEWSYCDYINYVHRCNRNTISNDITYE